MYLKLVSLDYNVFYPEIEDLRYTGQRIVKSSIHDYIVYGTDHFLNTTVAKIWDVDDIDTDNFLFDYIVHDMWTIKDAYEAGPEKFHGYSDEIHSDFKGSFITFKSQGKKYLIFTNNIAYLCNDDGKTIEKI